MNLRWRIAQFFEVRWWQHYLSKRDKTAYLEWKRRYWRDFLEKSAIEIPANAVVLDAGCGPAGIFIILENQTVDALDSLLDDYEKSLSHFCRADYPRVRFFNKSLENFFPEKQYDFVFCLNALNHMADLAYCLKRLIELTKPGGTLTISIDAHNYSWLKRFFRLVPADILHPHQFDLSGYLAMLTAHNLRPECPILMKNSLIFNYYLLVAKK